MPDAASQPAVFDTNILASAFTSPRGAPRALLEYALHGDVQLVTSPALLDKFEDCLVEVRYERRMAAATRSAIEDIALVVEPASVPQVCRDPDDDHVLAAGVTGRAEYIVTRDKDLLTLGSYEGIPIVEPAPFLHLVRERLQASG